jgi:phosphoribosylformylglycinamidine synthase
LCATLIEQGWVRTAHDVSDGGLAVALAEMCLAGNGIGCKVDLAFDGRIDRALFGESGCRVVVTVLEELAFDLEQAASEAGVVARRLGVTGDARLVVRRLRDAGRQASEAGDTLVDVAVAALRERWEATLPAIAAGRGR